MNTLHWKHKEHGHVVNHINYDKLPKVHQSNYYQTTELPTHNVNDNEDNTLSLITGLAVAESMFDNSSNDTTSDYSSSNDSSSSTDFGGGDFGGGGNSDSW